MVCQKFLRTFPFFILHSGRVFLFPSTILKKCPHHHFRSIYFLSRTFLYQDFLYYFSGNVFLFFSFFYWLFSPYRYSLEFSSVFLWFLSSLTICSIEVGAVYLNLLISLDPNIYPIFLILLWLPLLLEKLRTRSSSS